MEPQSYPYKPNTLTFGFALGFFALCTAIMVLTALDNDRGLILSGIFEITVEGATIFYWSIAALSGVLVVGGIAALLMGLRSDREIVVTATAISAPKSGISPNVVSIDFADISNIKIVSINKQRIMSIQHPGGKLTISQAMLADKKTFDELAGYIKEKSQD